ncbi:ABC transporter [Streptomyces sp. CRN 30]|uniref:ABC transporter n=1 Tax=Streptomyces sp. CRN 30 TaxID=3075613 RepID=UPI002A82B53E|nr:ABC transporter [Streptomyces sp. CRN 30]
MRGLRDVRTLARPVARTVPWRALAAAGGTGLLLAGLPGWADREPAAGAVLLGLRGAALAGGLGLAFLLDDPARHTTAAVPVPRPLRQVLRAVTVAPLVVLWWTAVLLVVPADVRPPAADVTLEAGAVALLAVAGAAAVLRTTHHTTPGRGVATGLLLAAVAAPLLLPHDWDLFVQPTDPRWPTSHDRWAVVLATAAAGWAWCARETSRIRRR